MKLRVLADLHLEFGTVEVPPTDADVIVCAGGVHSSVKVWNGLPDSKDGP